MKISSSKGDVTIYPISWQEAEYNNAIWVIKLPGKQIRLDESRSIDGSMPLYFRFKSITVPLEIN